MFPWLVLDDASDWALGMRENVGILIQMQTLVLSASVMLYYSFLARSVLGA